MTMCLLIAAVNMLSAIRTDENPDNGLLDNGVVQVRVNAAQGQFTLTHKESGIEFVRDGVLLHGGGTCRLDSMETKAGKADVLRVTHAQTGTQTSVLLLDDSPFVFVSGTLNGTDGEPAESWEGLRLPLNLPDAGSLKALGTAGLTAPDGHPGSYGFLAVADPGTRHGIVTAWATSMRGGSGVVFSSVEDGRVVVSPRLEYGDRHGTAEEGRETDTLVIGYFDDARLGLEQYADTVARLHDIRLKPIPSGYCTWYSNPHGGASDEKHLAELARFAKERLAGFGLGFIQIDDLWQGKVRNLRPLDVGEKDERYYGYVEGLPIQGKGCWWWGPCADFTAPDPQGPYRGGMKATADTLNELGFTAGLWLMPFAWDPTAPALKDHHDWFVKRPDGSLYYAYWAGWSLDMTHPDARDFLRASVSRIVHDWGYRYLKLDALFSGAAVAQLYVNDGYKKDDLGDQVFHDDAVTPIEAYRQGLETVRDAAGEDAFILGCNVSQNMRTLTGSYGLVDAMRIGPDNGPGFNPGTAEKADFGGLKEGPWHGTNRYFLHGRVWHNDPDPVYVRNDMPIEHARLIASWVALSGQLTVFSDWLPGLEPDRLDICRRVLPNHGLRPRPVDLFESELARIWLLTDTRDTVRRDVVGLFSWNEKDGTSVTCPSGRLGLPEAERYVGFDFWANEFIEPFGDTLSAEVPVGSCRIIAVRPAAGHPQVVSTSRHLSQGMVDLRNERWDPAVKTLSGDSDVAGMDPYELRIVLPDSSWEATLAVAGNHASASVAQEPGSVHVRATITSNENRSVHWTISFR